MKIIILCGGSGSRLWPLSRKNYPKQFLTLYGDTSLLQATYLRARTVAAADDIFFITNYKNHYTVFNQIRGVDPKVEERQILSEPEARNTAPAIVYALAVIRNNYSLEENEPIIITPSDHFVGNEEVFTQLLAQATEVATRAIVTIGIKPESAHTGFGYIEKGEKLGDTLFRVAAFKEKPDTVTAQRYVESGNYLWNGGMYVFTPKVLAEELKKHDATLYSLLMSDATSLERVFKEVPKLSFDYAVAEKSDNLYVIEGAFGWNDVGSFDAVIAMKKGSKSKEQQEDTPETRHVGIDSENVHVFGTRSRLVATLGVSDLIIVENNDSTLICKSGRSEDIKKLVQHLEEQGRTEVEGEVVVHRPWGNYEVLMDTPTYKVKKIVVYPGAKLSLQSHTRRAEHWVVVTGVADVVNGDAEYQLNANESAYIKKGARHQLANSSDANLEIIEVQTGDYLGEDDITRYEDVYHRV